MSEDQQTVSVRLNKSDRPFLDEEALRIMQERFDETGRLERPSMADVVSDLLAELRALRQRARECSCEAQALDDVRLR